MEKSSCIICGFLWYTENSICQFCQSEGLINKEDFDNLYPILEEFSYIEELLSYQKQIDSEKRRYERPLYEKGLCQQCGKEARLHKQTGKVTKFCSYRCATLYFYIPVSDETNCIFCNKKFKRIQNNRRFCSDVCRLEQKRKQSREFNRFKFGYGSNLSNNRVKRNNRVRKEYHPTGIRGKNNIVFKHGTTYSYMNKSCRCEVCIKAHEDYLRDRRLWTENNKTKAKEYRDRHRFKTLEKASNCLQVER